MTHGHQRTECQALTDTGGADTVTITEFNPHPEYVGHNIGELARERKISAVEMYIQIVREGDAVNTEASVIGKSMIERDIQAFYQQPWVMVGSDGGIGSQHPRGAGTFPRVLGLYVRDKHWLSLPEAVHKMTEAQVRKEMAVHPLQFLETNEALPWQHIFIFQKSIPSGRTSREPTQ